MPDDTASQSPPSTPGSISSPKSNPLKRKVRPDENDKVDHPQESLSSTNPLPTGSNVRPDEYAAGFVTCETCGMDVSFRDGSNGFTTEHWDAHRANCPPSAPAMTGGVASVPYGAPDTAPDTLSHPPTKRRRAKRTEEERIEYLRQDPYVGQFEAYRVLCASCDKWIRLRPNSTYCSIPWDAHRKSCLAKKINNKNVYALEERNNLFSKDPDVRKFDPERLLCNICDKWLSLPSDDHLAALQKWDKHRASCQKAAGLSSEIPQPDADAPTETQPSGSRISSSASPKLPVQPPTPGAATTPHMQNLQHPRFPPLNASAAPSRSPSSFHDLNPSNYAPAHESRRRNAEQRAATLRADRLIGEVEPNRVFCSLCQKWVQLRQDSSYCAYPWLQHRGKCLARHQRRTQKAAEMADVRSRKQPLPSPLDDDDDVHMSDHEVDRGGSGAHQDRVLGHNPSEDLESEEGVDSGIDEDRMRRKEKSRMDQRHFNAPTSSSSAAMGRHYYGSHNPHHPTNHGPHSHQQSSSHHPHHYKSRSAPYGASSQRYAGGSMSQAISSSAYRHDSRGRPSSHHTPPHTHSRPAARRPYDEDMDADCDDDDDAEGEYLDGDGRPLAHPLPPTPPVGTMRGPGPARAVPRRPWPVGLADLDSSSGRKQFIFGSVEYLFSTTYESTDDMSISVLLTYLNAAMPPDKHEDFDTTEVVRAVAAMKEKGRVIFEGDILRLID